MTLPIDPLVDELVGRALAEDLHGGDLTTLALVGKDNRAIARAVARSTMVVCGGAIFARAFYLLDGGLRVEQIVPDGELVERGAVLAVVEGATASILSGERVALNFMQRLSGVATLARRFVDAVPSGRALRVTDTRKTTPGLRALERYAVRVGGANNHRDNLGAAILIKDNHILAAGGIGPALERARRHAPHTSRVSIEVESLTELDLALEHGADVIMLDNFEPAVLREAVQRAKGRALIEVSGGVTLERIPEIAEAGADVVSVGALTHSAPAADIGLDLEQLALS